MRYRYGLPPDEQLKAIGMVTAQWQRLESIVNFGIWSLSGTEQNVAEAITAHLNLHTRLDILQALYRLRDRDGDSNERLKNISKQIRNDLSGKRNDVVHGLWVRGDFDTAMMLLITARGELKRNQATRSAVAIEQIAGDIAKAADTLERFLSDHHVTLIEMESQQGN